MSSWKRNPSRGTHNRSSCWPPGGAQHHPQESGERSRRKIQLLRRIREDALRRYTPLSSKGTANRCRRLSSIAIRSFRHPPTSSGQSKIPRKPSLFFSKQQKATSEQGAVKLANSLT